MVTTAVWTNWAGTASCHPAETEFPRSEEDIVAAVKRAVAAGERVKVAGTGHSFTDIACTGGRMLRLNDYSRVLDVDRERNRVTVEAGITIWALADELARHGLAFPNLGDIGYQAIAGAISTATHGTGAKLGNLATQVVSMRLVLADGSILEVSEAGEPETFRAAQVSLGALGVISTLTLQCVPAFNLTCVEEPGRFEDVLASVEEQVASNDHFWFWWFPHTDGCIVKTYNRTDAQPEPRGKVRTYVEDMFLGNHVARGLLRLGRARPGLIPRINRLAVSTFGRRYSDRSDQVFTTPRLMRFSEMEYAIPRANLVEAIRAVKSFIDEKGFRISFPVECRMVAPDDIFLSPSYGRETAYVAVHVFQGMEYEPYFRGVEEIMRRFRGRPHWGKIHYQTHHSLRELYPAWGRFANVRARLDPQGRFANAYLDRVLGMI